jgi:Ca2+-binding RTX toxin-like protein
MAHTLIVTATHDYTGDAIGVVDNLTFLTSELSPTATFDSSQLSNLLHVIGDGALDHINLEVPTQNNFSAAGWTFSIWAGGYVSIRGHAGGNSITGSSTYNIIFGKGTHTLNGGDSGNSFAYEVASDAVHGQTVAGGAGVDTLNIGGTGTYNFASAHFSDIDELVFGRVVSATPTKVILAGNQIGAGGLAAVTDQNPGDHICALIVKGSDINLSALLFLPWFPADSVTLKGTSGDDRLIGSAKADALYGRGGDDRLNGGGDKDVLSGGAGADRLKGGDGADLINGGGGDDLISGGAGRDILKGAGGLDAFVFDAVLGAGNVDHIADFAHAADKIALEHSIFSAIPTGSLAAGAFHLGGTATTPANRILYAQSHGKLYYDDDGTGPDGKVLFAVLDNHAPLTASDFEIG